MAEAARGQLVPPFHDWSRGGELSQDVEGAAERHHQAQQQQRHNAEASGEVPTAESDDSEGREAR